MAGADAVISALGPSDPHDNPHWKPKVLPVMAKLAFPNALTELKGMTEAVTSSPLDYTIARITTGSTNPPPAASSPASWATTRSARR
ncbi:hypothetical protein [Streptomyces sp. NBC_01334]|uniref:hypothetical protein n=1 Tax=Streptomyces sp. NBC_01334 TaxID=2903827 RepID=UPI002E1119DA|nr:hypothetical protein OG736_42815 [Streptomyces sp. NBC_01334]